MIKEILEYGDGPSPIPRMPLSQYPMGMVPGIRDQVSDHLKRNWLWYLLGGGMLFGPGMNKRNAFNKAITARDNLLAQHAQHQAAYDKNKKAYLDAQYSNFGSDQEKEAAFQRDQQDRLSKANDHHSKALEHAQSYNSSFASKIPFLGGEVSADQSLTNPGLFSNTDLNGSGIDAVQQAKQKEFDRKYQAFQDKLSDESDKYMKANPNAKESELHDHLQNVFKNHADLKDDIFSDFNGPNGERIDLKHFIRSHLADRAADREYKRNLDGQQDIEKSIDNSNLNPGDINKLTNDKDKFNKSVEFLQKDNVANQHVQNLDNWQDKFDVANTTSSPIDTLTSLGKNIAPEWIQNLTNLNNIKQQNIPDHQRLMKAAEGAITYAHAINSQDGSYLPGQSTRVQDVLSNALFDKDGNRLDIKDNIDHRNQFQKNISDYLHGQLANAYGLDKEHVKSFMSGLNNYDDHQNRLNLNNNSNTQSSGNTGSSGGSPTPNYDDEFNKMWNHNNLSDNDRNKISSMWGWDNGLDHKSDQDYLNAASNLIHNNRTTNDFYKNANQGTLNDVAKMIKASHSGGLANDIQGAADLVQNHIDKFNNPSQQSGQTQQPSTWSDVKNGFNNNMQQRSATVINNKLGTQNNSTPFNIQNHGQALSKQVAPQPSTNVSASNSNINDIIKSYLFNEDSDEFGRSSGRIIDDEGGFLKKHWGKILAGLAAGGLGVVRNHLKANAHENNAEYFYSKGNRSLGDDELAKARVKRSIDPIYKAKNMYHSMRERFGK